MVKILKAGWKDYSKLKTLILRVDYDFDFFSNYDGNILLDLLAKRCYKIVNGNKISALLIKHDFKREIFFIPLEANVSFKEIVNELQDNLLSGYKIEFYYRNIDLFKKLTDECSIKLLKNYKLMVIDLSKLKSINQTSNLNNLRIRSMIINKEEDKRVILQNSIFGENLKRKALSLEEVKSEERKKEFISDLCFFLTYNDEDIGYGQIIKSSEGYYLINFGIVPEYRGFGYGKFFLNEILNKAKEYGIKELFLKVENDNIRAVNLYFNVGFEEIINAATIII
ncbi:MAG: GNAT family N-acetyltransferase [Caloramator sp.]|nr:GNAT family N-acetyltransferase [Caloramator sp.]